MCIICGKPPYIQCDCTPPVPFCDQCESDERCRTSLDSSCVIYHYDTDKPTKLVNLGLPNGTSAEKIFEAIDALIGKQFQTPFTPKDTNTIHWTVLGAYGHSPRADVEVSEQSGNTLVKQNIGLYVPADNYKIKTDDFDIPDVLQTKLIGGTDGIITISVNKVGEGSTNLLEIVPKIDVLALLNKIDTEFRHEFCDLVNDCITAPPSGDTEVCEAPTITSALSELQGDGTSTLTVTFTPPSPAPADGYTIYYRKKGTGGAYIFQAVASSPAVITALSPGNYEGYIVADCAHSISNPVPFETSNLTVHIVNSLPAVDFDAVHNITGFNLSGTLTTGQDEWGTHSLNGSAGICCDLSGTPNSSATLKLRINGVDVQCVALVGAQSPGNCFNGHTIHPTDFIEIEIQFGTC